MGNGIFIDVAAGMMFVFYVRMLCVIGFWYAIYCIVVVLRIPYIVY